jgi:hypothetical protein
MQMDHNINQYETSGDHINDPQTIESVGKYLVRFLEEGRKNHFPILSKISDPLAIQIWITACQFINKQLENDKSVQITQLGTFSFSSKRLDIGNNKFIIVQRPVFLLSERLAQTHGITYTKHHVSGEIPLVKMNYTAIAIAMGRERDLVEGCIREILQALSRVISYREPVQFLFYNIGYLVVRDFRARVKFTPGFIKRMDGTGQLSRVLESRARGRTSKTRAKDSSAPSIPARSKTSAGRLELRRPCEPRASSLDRVDETNVLKLSEISENPVPSTLKSPQSSENYLPRVGLYSSSDRVSSSKNLMRGNTPPTSQVRLKSADSVASSVGHEEKNHLEDYKEFVKRTEQNQDIENNLSYVAFQRQQLIEEKRQREAQADAILQRYQDRKDQTAMHRERRSDEVARTRAKDVAGFNLKTCLEASEQDLASARRPNSPKAYIFKNRPLTPARFKKQHEYSDALAGQVDSKATRLRNHTESVEKSERLEQQQLQNEIDNMKEDQRANTKANQQNYRKSLASQIRVKSEISKRNDAQEELAEPSIPTVPYFGRNHITSASGLFGNEGSSNKAMEEKARAKALFKAQLAMASEKRQSAIKKHLNAQQKEAQVLRRTHTELFSDQKRSYESSVKRRQSLEENWVRHAKDKKNREQQHQEFQRNGRQLTVKETELHDKYDILFKPQPTGYTSGRFKSNIWRESRYIPGSRLMV